VSSTISGPLAKARFRLTANPLIGELSSKLLDQLERLRASRSAYPAARAELGLIAGQKTARH